MGQWGESCVLLLGGSERSESPEGGTQAPAPGPVCVPFVPQALTSWDTELPPHRRGDTLILRNPNSPSSSLKGILLY